MMRTLALMISVVVVPVMSGCSGGIHSEGEHQFRITGSYGHPIKGECIWPDGDGRAENVGVSLEYGHFVKDRTAIVGAITPWRNYSQSDADIPAGEFQLGVRYYFFEFDIANTPVGLYGELLGGIQHSAKSVPELGTQTNFTQDSGLGFEVQFTDSISWVGGYRLRHLSHGHVFAGEPNPSQNDNQVYTGIAITIR